MTTQPTSARGLSATRQKIRLAILFFMVMAFPILMNYFSVFLIIEGSSQGIIVFSFFFWSAWVLGALIFGRAACGWLCPLGAVQETKDRMTPRDLSRIKHLKWVKYVLAAGWVGAIVFFAIAAGGYHTVNLLYMTESGVSIASPQSWFTWGTIVIVILLPAFLIGRRGFCHYFCPWGVLNTVSTKISNLLHLPSLHLEAVEGKCRNCRTCMANCPMSLSVAEMIKAGSVKNDECILCGTCVDNCPSKAIKYSWAAPQRETARTTAAQHVAQWNAPETIDRQFR
jgi:polyferredoxin